MQNGREERSYINNTDGNGESWEAYRTGIDELMKSPSCGTEPSACICKRTGRLNITI